MNRHYFQHVPFEGLGSVGAWIGGGPQRLGATRFYHDEPLQGASTINCAITSGGANAACSCEDWALVARIAPQLGEHPQPPMGEKMRILAFVGADVAKFKSHDEKTHQTARALEEAAARNDGASVIAAFATLQNSCLACHQNFRKPFVEHFYGQG